MSLTIPGRRSFSHWSKLGLLLIPKPITVMIGMGFAKRPQPIRAHPWSWGQGLILPKLHVWERGRINSPSPYMELLLSPANLCPIYSFKHEFILFRKQYFTMSKCKCFPKSFANINPYKIFFYKWENEHRVVRYLAQSHTACKQLSETRFGCRCSSPRVFALDLFLWWVLTNTSLLELDGYKPTFPLNYEPLDGRGHLGQI